MPLIIAIRGCGLSHHQPAIHDNARSLRMQTETAMMVLIRQPARGKRKGTNERMQVSPLQPSLPSQASSVARSNFSLEWVRGWIHPSCRQATTARMLRLDTHTCRGEAIAAPLLQAKVAPKPHSNAPASNRAGDVRVATNHLRAANQGPSTPLHLSFDVRVLVLLTNTQPKQGSKTTIAT